MTWRLRLCKRDPGFLHEILGFVGEKMAEDWVFFSLSEIFLLSFVGLDYIIEKVNLGKIFHYRMEWSIHPIL